MSAPIRVLVVDDIVPDAALGTGYPRLESTIRAIQEVPGAEVSIYPTIDVLYPSNEVGAIRAFSGPRPLGVITGVLGEYLEAHPSSFDIVVISRPHNYRFVADDVHRYLPGAPVVYDAEALFFRRTERHAAVASDRDRASLAAEAEEMRALEERICAEAAELVFVSVDEAEEMRPFATGRITVNSPLLDDVDWTPKGFFDRDGAVFVAGWASGPASPNVDGMAWLAREVWPRVLARLPTARLVVTGNAPPARARRFASATIGFAGQVEELADVYGAARVAVAPNRFGAGVKNKTIEALQYGVPVVATRVGAEGVPVDPEGAAGLVVADDAAGFAAALVRLMSDETAWESARTALAAQCARWDADREGSAWPAIIERLARGRDHA